MDDDGAHSCDHSSSDASSLVADLLPNRNNIIKGQQYSYSVGRKLAQGRFGAVYEVLRRGDGKHLAAKLEVCDSHFHGLNMDYNVLKYANRAGLRHFCQLIDRGKIEGHFKFVVMQLLSDNIDKYRQDFQGNRFSAPTCIRLGLEMLSALEELHSLGYVHRDVKPSNFVVHDNKGQTRICIIDFGLCKQYRNSNGEMRTPREKAQFRGTLRYASLAAHKEEEQAPKDDLESWLYVLVELFTGELPWTHYRKSEKPMIKQLKEQTRTVEGTQQLFKYCPRTEFRRIMKYLDGLGYHSHVDYTYVRQLINLATKNYDIRTDQPYDWEIDESDLDTKQDNDSTPRGHSSNSSSDGRSEGAPDHQPTISEKLDKMVQRLNGTLQLSDSNDRIQNGN